MSCFPVVNVRVVVPLLSALFYMCIIIVIIDCVRPFIVVFFAETVFVVAVASAVVFVNFVTFHWSLYVVLNHRCFPIKTGRVERKPIGNPMRTTSLRMPKR